LHRRAQWRHKHMATYVAESAIGATARELGRPLRICHFTTAHTELKSRSFHRQLMPLAAGGVEVRYLAPVASGAHRNGVDVIGFPARRNRLRRILSLPRLLPLLLRQEADLYHFQDPELLPVAFVLKLVFRRLVVYDAYEDFPSMVANKKFLPRPIGPLAAKIIDGTERLAACCFDGLMTADPLTLRRLAKTGASKKLVLYNFPNLDLFPGPTLRPKRFDVVCRGGLSERAGTYVLLDAMRLLAAQNRRVRLLLIGYFDDLSAEKRLRERIREFGLTRNIVIRGRMDHERMAEALSEARIGVCPLQPIPKFMRNIPVKVFEYWACGLPVVASDLPPIRPFLRHAEAGLLSSPESAVDLAQAIAWLLDNPQAAARMGRRGRDLVVQRLNNSSEVHKLRRFCAQIAARECGSVKRAARRILRHA
jgi:glycosyltransferase involved in cell wall biosynthesis